MSTLKMIYFPGTSLYSARQLSLFLIPASLNLLQVVEDSPLSVEEDWSDSFIKNGFCQGYTPVPLGENRERFLHLINDIRHRKDDYAAQISHLTLASLGAEKADESNSEILSGLMGTSEAKVAAKAENKSWQNHLILKLAEILEVEEEELSRNLAILEMHEDDLFAELQGQFEDDEESPFADLQDLKKNMSQYSSTSDKKRFLAWKNLFVFSDLIDQGLLCTDNHEAAEEVLEYCAHKKLDLRLELPAIISWDMEEALQHINAFRQENRDLLSSFAGALMEKNMTEALCAEMQAAIDASFDNAQHGRRAVSFYLLEAGAWQKYMGQEGDTSCLLLSLAA